MRVLSTDVLWILTISYLHLPNVVGNKHVKEDNILIKRFFFQNKKSNCIAKVKNFWTFFYPKMNLIKQKIRYFNSPLRHF